MMLSMVLMMLSMVLMMLSMMLMMLKITLNRPQQSATPVRIGRAYVLHFIICSNRTSNSDGCMLIITFIMLIMLIYADYHLHNADYADIR